LEINRDILKRLDGVDSEQLRKATLAIARALGANPMQAMMASHNVEQFKAKANLMSDEEFNEAVSKIPPEKAAEILRMLGADKREKR